MTQLKHLYLGSGVEPLSEQEVQHLEMLGDQLRNELAVLLNGIPNKPRSVMALSRQIGVDRNTCQKVAAALLPEVQGAAVISRVPGPEALRVFVTDASKAGGLAAPSETAMYAVQMFESAIRTIGGSQSRLIQRLRASGLSTDRDAASRKPRRDPDEVEARRRLFNEASDVSGSCVDVLPCVSILRPVPGAPDKMQCFTASGLIGLSWDSGPMPLGSLFARAPRNSSESATEPQGTPTIDRDSDHGLIREFCSDPFPTLHRRKEGNNASVFLIDSPEKFEKVDILYGMLYPGDDVHPRLNMHQCYTQALVCRRPTRRLLIDVYMHEAYAKNCVPMAGMYTTSPELLDDPRRFWYTRLPGRFSVELLGQGLANAPTPAWPKHQRFVQYLFDRIGWSSELFVGFRCEIEYPIWNSVALISFDFSDPSPISEHAPA